MPTRSPRPCRTPGCSGLSRSPGSRCERCGGGQAHEIGDRRGSAASRGYDARHRAMREVVLREEPVCRICGVNAAKVADHIVPLETARTPEERELLMQRSNYQGACDGCHNRKRATTDKAAHRAARGLGAPRPRRGAGNPSGGGRVESLGSRVPGTGVLPTYATPRKSGRFFPGVSGA